MGIQTPYQTGQPFPVTDPSTLDAYAGAFIGIDESLSQLEPEKGVEPWGPLDQSLAAVAAWNAAHPLTPLSVVKPVHHDLVESAGEELGDVANLARQRVASEADAVRSGAADQSFGPLHGALISENQKYQATWCAPRDSNPKPAD
jgi:hypothetical protein